jgi:hypothetical protein
MKLHNKTDYQTDWLKLIINSVYEHTRKELTKEQIIKVGWGKLILNIEFRRGNAKRNNIKTNSINLTKKKRLDDRELAYLASGLIRYRANLKNIWQKPKWLDNFSSFHMIPKKHEAPRSKKPDPITNSSIEIQNLSEKDFASHMRAKRNAAKKDNASGTR